MIEAEFVAALDDPTTRVVYADWLEQRGDPRAELVRIALNGNRQLDLGGACRILARAPNLRELSIGQMDLTRLPDELALLTQLRSLSVSYNRLVDIDVLRRLPDLESLDAQSGDLHRRWSGMHPRRDEQRL